LLLVNHAIGTRGASTLHDYEDSYTMVVLLFWELRPDLGLLQSLLVVVAWTHGCIGIHYWLRIRGWYNRVGLVLYTLAVLLPVLALLGFAQAGRYVSVLAREPGWVQQTIADARVPDALALAALTDMRDALLLALALLLLLTFAARALRQFHESSRSVRITYPGGQVVSVPKGFTILESSRQAGIAHASVCGGRGRCSTCRVRVLQGVHQLPPPDAAEARVLTRLGTAPNVRLACQLRPLHDLAVLPLLPPSVTPDTAAADPGFMAGQERELCVLFADLRGFTALSERRLPYDVVFLLNRYFEVVGKRHRGGRRHHQPVHRRRGDGAVRRAHRPRAGPPARPCVRPPACSVRWPSSAPTCMRNCQPRCNWASASTVARPWSGTWGVAWPPT
jgi:adenylate cyclase